MDCVTESFRELVRRCFKAGLIEFCQEDGTYLDDARRENHREYMRRYRASRGDGYRLQRLKVDRLNRSRRHTHNPDAWAPDWV